MDRIPELLIATLSRESRPDYIICHGSQCSNLAIWRCIDCTLSLPLCRKCMRESHNQAPFHRIEIWNGSFFRPASLWEVGSYLLIQHHGMEALCDTLQFQKTFLDSQQTRKDEEEQWLLRKESSAPEPGLGPGSGPSDDFDMENQPGTFDDDSDLQHLDSWKDDTLADAAFESSLNNWLFNSNQDNLMDIDKGLEIAATDINNVVEYLGPFKESCPPTQTYPGPDITSEPISQIPRLHTDFNPDHVPDPGSIPDMEQGRRPTADGLNNAYVRVLHTNGIHHIGMVTCTCHGQDKIPYDLVACRLLPASFIRIRTIFTTQLMDYFRLCNLELKASAYQFYNLIQRLTLPLGQSEMVNLYHEFRRMSRLWRWMKKLKWAGYGHNKQDHLKPPAGSLSIFCPTCPQPALNLPDDWKLDKNRFVLSQISVC